MFAVVHIQRCRAVLAGAGERGSGANAGTVGAGDFAYAQYPELASGPADKPVANTGASGRPSTERPVSRFEER